MGNEGSHEMEYMAFIFVACWLASEFCPSGNVCLLEIEMTAFFFLKKKKLVKLALFSIKLVSSIHLKFLNWVGLKNKTEKVEGIMCHCTILEQLLKERIICAPASKHLSQRGKTKKNYKASSVEQKWETATTFLHVHATIFSFLAMFSPSLNTY